MTEDETYHYLGPKLLEVSAADYKYNYTYNLNGDRKTKTYSTLDGQGQWVTQQSWDYEYNADRFLSRVLLGGAEKRSYAYAGDSYKIARERRDGDPATDVRYMRDGDSVMAEFDAAGAKTAEFFGNALDRTLGEFRGSEAIWNLHGPGGVMAVTDSGGSVTSRFRYDAFGKINPLSTTPTLRTRQRTFHGRPRDDYIGLVNFRNRWFDPDTGQFAQSDKALDPHNWNSAYNFCDNDPINKSDPMGTMLTVQRKEQAEQIASKFRDLGLNAQIFRRGFKPYGYTVQLRGFATGNNSAAKIKAARAATYSTTKSILGAMVFPGFDPQSKDYQVLDAALSNSTSYYMDADGNLAGEHPDKLKAMLEGAADGATVGAIAVANATVDTLVGIGTLGMVDSVGLIPAPDDPLYGMAYGVARIGTELLAGAVTGGLGGGAGTISKVFKVMDVATNVIQTARNLGAASDALAEGNLGSAALNLTMAVVNGASVRGALGRGASRRAASRGGAVEFSGATKSSRYASDLRHVTGKTARARNRQINATIKKHLGGVKFKHKARYNPFLESDSPRKILYGVALEGAGTQVSRHAFKSKRKLIETLVHEELHHRWWSRGIYNHHKNPALNKKFERVVARYMKRMGL